jgi:predicted amidohydrolase
MTLHMGGCQLASTTSDLDDNVRRIETAVRRAKDDDPALALFALPELATTGYASEREFFRLAVSWPDGGYLPRLAALAKECALVLVVGFAEATGTYGVIADSAAVFGPDGAALGVYRKTHCLDRERHFFVNGDTFPLFPVGEHRFGIAICWDMAMPEVGRIYALAGADLIVAIGAWEDPYRDDWTLSTSARAYDNVTPVLGVNRTGTERGASFSGGSRLLDALGRPIAELDREEDGLLLGALDMAATRELRAEYGSQLRDRRPELYGPVCRPLLEAAGD